MLEHGAMTANTKRVIDFARLIVSTVAKQLGFYVADHIPIPRNARPGRRRGMDSHFAR
jgi:hypothetical protein